jgi:hypothetical protein
LGANHTSQVVIAADFALFKGVNQLFVPRFKFRFAQQKTFDRKITLFVVPRIGEKDPADIPEKCADRWHRRSYRKYL